MTNIDIFRNMAAGKSGVSPEQGMAQLEAHWRGVEAQAETPDEKLNARFTWALTKETLLFLDEVEAMQAPDGLNLAGLMNAMCAAQASAAIQLLGNLLTEDVRESVEQSSMAQTGRRVTMSGLPEVLGDFIAASFESELMLRVAALKENPPVANLKDKKP